MGMVLIQQWRASNRSLTKPFALSRGSTKPFALSATSAASEVETSRFDLGHDGPTLRGTGIHRGPGNACQAYGRMGSRTSYLHDVIPAEAGIHFVLD